MYTKFGDSSFSCFFSAIVLKDTHVYGQTANTTILLAPIYGCR